MSVEDNKATLARLYDEVWNSGNMSVIPELVSDDYHFANFRGHTGFENLVTTMRNVFPDMHWTIDSVVGEGEWLAVRLSYTGTFLGKLGDTEPTGRSFSATRALFNRFERGKLVEAVPYVDHLALYQQIGISTPSPVEEANKALIRRLYDLWNRRELAAALELMAPSYVAHFTNGDLSREQEAKIDAAYFAAFPDVAATIEDMVSEGDRLAIRVTWRGTHKGTYMGIDATGKAVEQTNTAIFRIAGGKVAELWATLDSLRFMQQLGVIPQRPNR